MNRLPLPVFLTLVLAAALLAPARASALSDEARCLDRELREAGRYAFCRMKAQSKGARSGELPTGEAIPRCADKFSVKWQKNLDRLGAACPVILVPTVIEPDVQACIDDLATNLAVGLAGPSACLSRELKDTGKFVACRLAALGGLIKDTDNGEVLLGGKVTAPPVAGADAADCDDKFNRLFTRTAERGDDCTNALDAAAAIALAEVCIDDVAISVGAQSPTTTTTLPPPPCGSGGPCAAFVMDDPRFCDEFGGLAGADALCQAAGDLMPERPYARAFVAWMSDGSSDARDRLTAGAGPYESTCFGHPTVAADLDDLTDGVIGTPLVCDSLGTGVVPFDENRQVWTATLQDGTFSGLDCDGWSDRNVEPATTGTAIATGEFTPGRWTDNATRDEFPALFYCFEVAAP